jgi:hypothetical protein
MLQLIPLKSLSLLKPMFVVLISTQSLSNLALNQESELNQSQVSNLLTDVLNVIGTLNYIGTSGRGAVGACPIIPLACAAAIISSQSSFEIRFTSAMVFFRRRGLPTVAEPAAGTRNPTGSIYINVGQASQIVHFNRYDNSHSSTYHAPVSG